MALHAQIVDPGRPDALPGGLVRSRVGEERTVLRDEIGVGEARAAHRPHAIGQRRVEQHVEPGDSSLGDGLVDDIRLGQAGLGSSGRRVLDLDRYDTGPDAVRVGSDLAGERPVVDLLWQVGRRVILRTRQVPDGSCSHEDRQDD
ncbi:MAG: hypothetical protein RQ731_02640 [Anaerosomatales bacterium]|nr:hypothetical protein [Anaerosomatales bacterium]MDT8433641.1 hypothetical protein [Anaerosomatales bacterium]